MAGLLTLLALLSVAPFLLAADPSSARAPACSEYCYEPIPVPGADSGAPGSNSIGGDETGLSSPGNSVAEQGTLTKAETVLGVLAADRTKDERITEANSKGPTSLPAGDVERESEERGASGIWVALLAVLGAGTLALILIGSRRIRGGGMSRADMIIRAAALAVGVALVYLVSPGVSGASAASAPRSFFGMMSIEQITEADAKRMVTGGVSAYRFPMSWDLVQEGPAAPYDWGSIDPTFIASAKAGLRVLPIMSGTPKGFASEYTTLPISSASQREGWANYLRAAIRRYGPGGEFWDENPQIPRMPVRTWQVWNEANFFYFAYPVSPSNYVKLLKASHKVIVKEDPGAKVMLSGLYGSPQNQAKRAMKSWQFLNKLYRLGAGSYFDSVALHPYSPNTSQLRLLIENVRDTLIRNGAGRTPIDITEIGWGSDSRTTFGKGSRRKQAEQLTSGFDFLINNRRRLGIRSAYWFAWKDMSPLVETCNFCYSSGLFQSGPGLRPKPAWDAFVQITGGARS